MTEISTSGLVEINEVGNGDPRSTDSFQGNKVKLFFCRALLIVAGTGPGKAMITINGHGLAKATTQFTLLP